MKTQQTPTRRDIQKLRSKKIKVTNSLSVLQAQVLARLYNISPYQHNDLVMIAIEEAIYLQLEKENKHANQ